MAHVGKVGELVVPRTSCLEHQAMDKVQKPSFSKYSTPSSEPFRNEVYIRLLTLLFPCQIGNSQQNLNLF
jgi:hypothetical protein